MRVRLGCGGCEKLTRFDRSCPIGDARNTAIDAVFERLRVFVNQFGTVWNSYSYEFVCFLGEFCRILTNDQQFQLKVGRERLISPIIQTLGRPFAVSQIYRMFPHFGEKFAKGSIQFGVGRITEGSAVLRMSFTDHVYQQFGPWQRRCAELICQTSKGGLAAVPEQVHHLRAASIKDLSCIADGDKHCEWQFTWPHQARAPHHAVLGAILIAILSFFLSFWVVRLGAPDATVVLPIIMSLLAAALWGATAHFTTLRTARRAREQLIQEQLTSVEARHEELREVYLQQEETSVELRQKVKQLTILHRAGLLFNSTLDREGLIQHVLQALVQDLHFDRAMFGFYDPVRCVVHDFRICGVPAEVAAFARSMEIPVTDPDSGQGTLLMQGQSLCVDDIRALRDRLHPHLQQLALMTQAKAVILVPLKVKDRIIGALTVDRTHEQMTQDDLDIMTTLANQVAIALDNAVAYHQIEELNIGLEARVRDRTAALENANQELGVANTELQQRDQLKSSFVSIVSHELRTPMTSIKGYVDNMLDGLTGTIPDRQRHYLNRIRHISERLTRTIDQLLDLSRIEAGQLEIQLETVPVQELVNEVVDNLKSVAQERTVVITLDADPAVPPMRADRDKINRVLTNLVQNAIKFTPKGGSIRIAPSARPDGFVEISVIDTGCGIPEQELDRVFVKFFRGQWAPPQVRGAGLGLAISKDLVELHGGQIWVESGQGQGSRFSFTIPMASPSP